MRVVVSVLMIVVVTALTLGAALLVVFSFADADRTLRIGSANAAPFLVMGPVAIGGLAGYWDRRASPASQRFLGWWFAGVAAIDVVAAVFIVLAALSARAPVWVPTLLVVGGAASSSCSSSSPSSDCSPPGSRSSSCPRRSAGTRTRPSSSWAWSSSSSSWCR